MVLIILQKSGDKIQTYIYTHKTKSFDDKSNVKYFLSSFIPTALKVVEIIPTLDHSLCNPQIVILSPGVCCVGFMNVY